MKKITIIAILAAFFIINGAKPAPALMIDGSQISAKISDFVKKIQDAANKVIQQVNQVKLMATQGFNLDALRQLAESYYMQYQQGSNQQMAKVVDGTQQRNRIILQDDLEKYSQASKKLYEIKLEHVNENKELIKKEYDDTKEELKQAKKEKEQVCADYEQEKDERQKSKKLEECSKLTAKVETLETNIKELNALQTKISDQQQVLINEQSSVGGAGDKVYDALNERLKTMDSSTDDLTFVQATDNSEWDKLSDVSKYQLTEEDYKKFLQRYFYDPKAMSGSSTQAFQSNMDRLMRERRYLVVNSAAHLLQVTATIRREIPVRTSAIKNMFSNTPSASSELEAMSSYSATRVENARALLLYAKLLSAKIQYMAARDLLDIEPKKVSTGKSYVGFDLGKYILTEEYVIDTVKESNKTIDYSNMGK